MKTFGITGFAALFAAILCTASCGSSSPDITDPPQKQAAAILNQGGSYKVGSPYKILGRWYYPKEDYGYKEVGTASWYGPDFHSKRTANGEKYDMHSLTAAHRTLPLPSIVRVTNLENGRSLVVRVNDRGPYARNRIIDVSKKVAQLLGFLQQGTAKVRVEVLEKESKNLKAALTGNPAYADVSAAPVPKIKMQAMAPIAGSIVAETTETAGIMPEAADPIAATVEAAEALTPTEPENDNNDYADNAAETDDTDDEIKSAGSFYVQAGAFSNKDAADKLNRKLSKFGNSTVTSANVNGKRFYRVRVGPYSRQSAALDTQAKIRDYGIPTAHIVEE